MCGRLGDMKHVPFPLRVAAGLAVTTAERARGLPKQLLELPITVASQVLQVSMRVQQHVTELAIKGDNALAALRRPEETPEWATFDEDLDEGFDDRFDSARNGEQDDPWAEEERALAADHVEARIRQPGGPRGHGGLRRAHTPPGTGAAAVAVLAAVGGASRLRARARRSPVVRRDAHPPDQQRAPGGGVRGQ